MAGHAFASVLRAAGEEPGSQAVVCDECGGDAGLRLRIAEWRRPSEGAIAFRLWTATLYPVEIAVGQSLGKPQGSKDQISAASGVAYIKSSAYSHLLNWTEVGPIRTIELDAAFSAPAFGWLRGLQPIRIC